MNPHLDTTIEVEANQNQKKKQQQKKRSFQSLVELDGEDELNLTICGCMPICSLPLKKDPNLNSPSSNIMV